MKVLELASENLRRWAKAIAWIENLQRTRRDAAAITEMCAVLHRHIGSRLAS
jgi:hypothetical protein